MFADLIPPWGYDETVTNLLLELNKAAAHGGFKTVSFHLLDYVAQRRPVISRTPFIDRLGFGGFTVPIPWKYAVLLNPKWVRISPESEAALRPSAEDIGGPPPKISLNTLRAAATLAHELGHALWNSHGFDSIEEEYFVDRGAAKAFWEMLLANGYEEEEATRIAQEKYLCLTMTLDEVIAEHRRTTKRHLLKPWTWFDRARPADITSNIVFLPWINLGVWGHGFWVTDRHVGKWKEKKLAPSQ
jgi:hypothetical protein